MEVKMEYLMLALLIAAIILMIIILLRQIRSEKNENSAQRSLEIEMLGSRLDDLRRDFQSGSKLQREELNAAIESNRRATTDAVGRELSDVRIVLNEKLDAIRGVVDEKLTKALDERLDTNFKQVADSLGKLYSSLGELSKLSGGVQDLNRTLSNVKTRGIWGEQQLGAILEDILTPSQYDTNAITKRGSSDRVEFAVKLPSKTGDRGYTYLPIDSKLPADIYSRLCDAADRCDPDGVAAASKELEQRIKAEAKSISTKYIDVPQTTDFAVMFLPTEGLYAEVLRIRGLSEWCQSSTRVMIAGPTTITALLTSLRVGFDNFTLNEKSAEVMKLLSAIKSQYAKFSDQIDIVQKRLIAASQSADELRHRSDIIQRKMKAVSELSDAESRALLEIGLDGSED